MAVIDDVARAVAGELPRREMLRRVGRVLTSGFLASLTMRRANAEACTPEEIICGLGCCSNTNVCCPGDVCVDTDSDPNHCGACDSVCSPGFACAGGTCTCPGTVCSGTCTNLNSDVNNCGACGNACLAGEFCIAGACNANPCAGVVCPLGSVCSNGRCGFPLAPADVYQVVDPGNLSSGDSYLNFTNAGTLNGFDPAGGICVNVYTFDPSEEMIACCSCYVSPDALRSLSVKQDILNHALTPSKPQGVVVKLVASLPKANSTCNPANISSQNFAPGMRAWSTSLHKNTSTGAFQVTENPFRNAVLSGSELEKLTTFCGYIQANGSGFGICQSCRVGGSLGGATR